MLGWQAMNHADLDQLLILQEKDVRISKLRKELASLPEQRTRLLKQMEAIKQKALAAKQEVAGIEKSIRDVEAAVETKRTYIGKMKTLQSNTRKNEEYQMCIQEVEKTEDAERDIFLLLIERVSGIGPATAIAILGSLSVEQFKQAVVGGDVSGIARAKGVGKKTAERIVLELKDKVGLAATWEAQAQGATSQAAGDAELALIALGFKQVESRKAIAAHLKDHPDADVDELIRAALRSMN